MPRTLNATLEAALDAQNFAKPIIRGWFMEDEVKTTTFDILEYKINLTELDIVFYTPGALASFEVCIERGLEINGTEYIISTIPFFLQEVSKSKGLWTAKGKISYPKKHNQPGYVTYDSAIDSWFQTLTATNTLTFEYLNAAASWINYKFFPVGKNIILNNAVEGFLSLLKQKYLVYVTDKQDLTALVFSVHDTFARTVDHTIILNELDNEVSQNKITYKDFRWIDEAGTYHTAGGGSYPIHNLGYLESTAVSPTVPTASNSGEQKGTGLSAKIPFHLKYMTGDKVTFITPLGYSITCVLEVTEVFKPNSDIPWRVELKALQYLSNTEGGALPSTIERVSNYTPLNTSYFQSVLSASDNNLQAAMDTIDDHDHSGGLPSDNITMPKVGVPTNNTLTEDFTARGSSGVIDGTLVYLTVGTSAAKVSVAAGEGYIRTSNDQQAPLVFCKWSASPDLYTFSAPAAGQETAIFFGISYNGGNPIAISSSTFSDFNGYDKFWLGRVSYDGTTMRILNSYAHAEDVANNTRLWMRRLFPFQREAAPEGTGGLELSVSLRALAMSTGAVWHAYNRYLLSAVASGSAFATHYKRAGGGFNTTSGVTSYPNTQYDDGSGTLATMTNNRYGCLWVYADIADGRLDVVYGAVNATSQALAQADTIPTTPNHLTYHGKLIGRIIYQKSGASPVLVESAWASDFVAGGGISQAEADLVYAPIAKGVTNGDSHNHVGGDGAALKFSIPFATHYLLATIAASTTAWATPFGGSTGASETGQVTTRAGTLKNAYVRIATAQPGTGSLVMTVRVNGVDTSIVITIAAGAAAGTYSNTANTATVAAGDRIAFRLVNNATGASAQVGPIIVENEQETT